MMDLGAVICSPRNPSCDGCPVSIHCEAKRHRQQNELPMKPPRKITPHYDVAVGIIWKEDKILIDLRPAEGLLGGLWEFPGGKKRKGETLEACLGREVREELTIEIAVRQKFITVRHAYSHFRVTLHVFECDYVSGVPRAIGCADWKWARPGELERYAFPTANRKIIAALQAKYAAKK
jgi:A/G-specific adenine glycosylase